MKRSEGTNAAFSDVLRREKSESNAGILKSFAVFGMSVASWRTGDTNGFTLLIVKSFAVLSVRERNSGNSELRTTHNSRVASAATNIPAKILRLGILIQPASGLIRLLHFKGKIYFAQLNRMLAADLCDQVTAVGNSELMFTTLHKPLIYFALPVSLRLLASCITLIWFISVSCRAQDLSPRAYIITPIHSNAVVLTYSFQTGGIVINPTLPINNTTGTLNGFIFSCFHTFGFFGRSANVTALLPYTVGNFRAEVESVPTQVYRSGLADSGLRFSVNLHGGPAMDVADFISWKQKLLVGTSITITAPTGQYDPMVLVNVGTNRWGLKPELGLSRRWGHWVLDTYGGVWFFTENHEYFSHNVYFPGKNTQLQNPLGAFQAHLSYDIRPRLWLSADANYFYGGSTNLNGVKTLGTLIANSRIGITASVPLHKHQSLKFSYNYGEIVRVGGHYHNVAIGWQYSWLGRPN
jgi:hypothetical protein